MLVGQKTHGGPAPPTSLESRRAGERALRYFRVLLPVGSGLRGSRARPTKRHEGGAPGTTVVGPFSESQAESPPILMEDQRPGSTEPPSTPSPEGAAYPIPQTNLHRGAPRRRGRGFTRIATDHFLRKKSVIIGVHLWLKALTTEAQRKTGGRFAPQAECGRTGSPDLGGGRRGRAGSG